MGKFVIIAAVMMPVMFGSCKMKNDALEPGRSEFIGEWVDAETGERHVVTSEEYGESMGYGEN